MAKPTSRSSVALGNKIQAAIAQAVQDHNHSQGKLSSALIIVVDENEEIKEMKIVPEDELTTFALVYEDKLTEFSGGIF